MMTQGRKAPPKENGSHPEPNAPMTAEEWSTGDVYRLPSGKRAKLRRPGLMAMLAVGSIPNPLATQVSNLITLRTTKEIEERTIEQRTEALLNNSKAFLYIAQLAFIEPELVTDRPPDRGKNQIGPADISDLDLMWLYYDFTEGTAADVAKFLIINGVEKP